MTATDPAGNVRTSTYRVAASGAGATYTYDPNGNLASKTEGTDNWTYEWNGNNELTRVTKNSVEQARFGYDPLGRRVEKVAGGDTTTYTYDSGEIVREVRGASTFKYVHGPGVDEPLASANGAALTYYHSDGLGSIVKVTNAAGVVALARHYDAWGNLESASEPGYAFTGREWDPEIGLYYYRARYYEPRIARFLSEDPIRSQTGGTLYGYVDGNPTSLVDPLGFSGSRPGGPYHPPDGVHTKCRPGDSCETIKGKMWVLKRMIDSHQGWDRNVPRPRGGNRHNKEIYQLWIQYTECEALYKENLCDLPMCDDKCKTLVHLLVVGIGLIPLCGPLPVLAF